MAGRGDLAAGYHLERAGRDFVVLDAHRRVGDAWRNRWDSLRLFTPNRYSALLSYAPHWRLIMQSAWSS